MEKIINFLFEINIKKIVVVGGVVVNLRLRDEFDKKCVEYNIEFFVLEFKYCIDNVVMIVLCGYFKL